MFSIVIPHWNNLDFLKKNLDSILASARLVPMGHRDMILDIIIIDNNSTDGSREYLRKLSRCNVGRILDISSAKQNEIKEKKISAKRISGEQSELIFNITVILNNSNVGFSKAVNQGIKVAKNDWIMVMNNDVKLDKRWFKEFEKELSRPEVEDEQVGCLFGKVLNWEGTEIESVGLDFDIQGKSKNIGNGEKNIEKYDQKKYIWGAPASIAVYKRTALEKVGYFDEDFFAYLEDVDLSIRLRAKGWKTLYIPKAVSYHFGGKTADQIVGFRQKYTARNWWYIIIKHYPFWLFLKNLPKILIEQTKNFLAIKSLKDKFWVVKELLVNFRKIWRKREPKQPSIF